MRILLILLILLPCVGCASPLIDEWADRGLVGVELARQNTLEFTGTIREQLAKQRAHEIDAVFEDILAAAEGNIEGVEVDRKWLEEHKQGLLLLLKLADEDRDALEVAEETALENLDQIAETFEQIKVLRHSWSKLDQVQVQVDRLTTLVLQIMQERRNR